MKIFDKFKNGNSMQPQTQPNSYTNHSPTIIEPFTILVNGQFNIFISALANDYSGLLNETEKEAFNNLLNAACIDIDGAFGNNIWNLKIGNFEIYNKENIIVSYEKRDSEVKDYYMQEGRANFAYQSKDGNIIIKQNDRNKKVFLVYVSEDLSKRLQDALRIAEARALGIQLNKVLANNNGLLETNENKKRR